MRRIAAVAGIAALAIALAGCVPSSGPLAVQPRDEPEVAEFLTGVVRIDDGCIWVEAADADYLPVFPVGEARVERGDLVFGGEYQDGDDIVIPGSGEAGEPGDDWYIPAACPDLTLWDASAPPQG